MSTSLERPNASVNEEHLPNSRPSLPRSNSIPSWPKNASMVSLRSPPTLQPSATHAQSLRKRHSTHVLTTDRAMTQVAVLDPSMHPLCSPALGDMTAPVALSKKTNAFKGLPSLAIGAERDIISLELQSEPMNDQFLQASPVTSDSSSPVSTRPRKFLATGPVSEVAPWEMYPVRRSATCQSSLTTGYVEEVTPWELHPVPTVMPNRSTLATGPLEDVTPWELGPAPPSTISEKQFSTRGSTSANQGKSPSEITHSRRRKSTSARPTKPRFTFFGSSFSAGHPSKSRNSPWEGVESLKKPTPEFTHTVSSQARLSPFAPNAMINGHDASAESQQNLDFLAADCTTIRELERYLDARDAEFIIKGEGTSLGSPLTRRGKKHHTFPPEKVPYPRSYEREVIDLDVWEITSCQDVIERWHVFQRLPTEVLDLGCGTGAWILNCAKAWKECHFVGLDIVPIQPDLYRVGLSDLASRITWVHANFLERLPFPDGEFDFVHIKRIALGVPENKWDGLFREVIRVMKPGGTFEMLEEDIFFPGKFIDINENLDFDNESENRSLGPSSHRALTKSYLDTNFESMVDSGPPSFRSIGHSPPHSTTATFPATPPRSNSPVADVVISEDMEREAQEILSYAIGDDYILPPEESSYGQALNNTLSLAATRGHSQVKMPQSMFASSTLSLNPSSTGSAVAPDSESSFKSKARTRSRAHSLSVFLSSATNSQQPSPVSEETPPPLVPFLLRTIPKPPPNPRDHSLLEAIYTRLLKSRSITMSPLALLTDYVRYYFQDVHTHPPLHYYFPVTLENCSSNDDGGNGEYSESERSSSDDTDDARDAILPSPISRTSRRKHSRRNPVQNRKEVVSISQKNHHVGSQGVIPHSAPHLDESSASISPPIKDTSELIDSKTLNLHLALRVAEIVACSEAMWEWVQKFSAKVKAHGQREAAGRPASRPRRSGSGSIEMPAWRSNVSIATSSYDPFESSILGLTREDFDGLISRFEMDMRDICDVSNALRERFSWYTSEPIVSTEREAFEKACEKWDKWEQEQSAALSPHVHSHDQSRNPPSGAYITMRPPAGGNCVQGRTVSMEQSKKRLSNTSGSPHRLSRSMCIFLARKA